MTAQQTTAAPVQIRLHRISKTVEVLWPDGQLSNMRSFDLRRACACSSCQAQQRQSSLRLIDVDVAIDKIELAGISGLQFHFSDGHSRGLFPWAYLRELGEPLS